MKNLPAFLSLFALLGGCSVTSIGAEDRAHREEAALHKLLDGQKSYSVLVQTVTKRDGYKCNEAPTEFLADRTTSEKFDPPKQGRHIVCSKSFDLNVPPISCSWRILFNADAIENNSVDFMSIDSFQACI
jgi:hypothetical protein